MTQLEKEIERKLVDMIKRHGGLCLKWVCPGWSGVPDRIILLPGGRIMFAELKRPKGGKVDALQAWWQRRFAELGFPASVIRTETDIAALELLISRGGGRL